MCDSTIVSYEHVDEMNLSGIKILFWGREEVYLGKERDMKEGERNSCTGWAVSIYNGLI